MDPERLGLKYGKIAEWWKNRRDNSRYGTDQLKNALAFCPTAGTDPPTAMVLAGQKLILPNGDKGMSVFSGEYGQKIEVSFRQVVTTLLEGYLNPGHHKMMGTILK